nr:hypothetical protein OH826_24245 [Streptomyces sp. NBC_00899]
MERGTAATLIGGGWDIYDFGLTGLIGHFHDDWGFDYETALDVVVAGASGYDSAAACDILVDAVRLTESPLASDVIMTLWLAAAARNYSPDRMGMDGREWLRAIVDVCVERVRRDGSDFSVPPPEAVSGEHAADVLVEIDQVAHAVTMATEREKGEEVYGVVPALRVAVRDVGPDLAFRLLLRVLYSYSVEISTARFRSYRALCERFGYGDHHLDGLKDLIKQDQ